MTKLIYIEHDGALFRGFGRSHPQEVWSDSEQAWKPYTFEAQWKPIGWGTEISEEEFKRLVAES